MSPITARASFEISTERLPESFRTQDGPSGTVTEVQIVDFRDVTWAVDIVAHCVWQEWWHDARARDHVNEQIAQSLTAAAFPLTLAALEGEAFMGTASAIYSDAQPRCGFAPWLSALLSPLLADEASEVILLMQWSSDVGCLVAPNFFIIVRPDDRLLKSGSGRF